MLVDAGNGGKILSYGARGLLAIPFLQGTFLEPITPVGDSLIVFALCLLVVGRYFQDFKKGLGELTGVTAPPDTLLTAGRVIRDTMADDPGRIVDIGVVKVGRTHDVAVFYDPETTVDADAIDDITRRVTAALEPEIGQSMVYVLVSRFDRKFA